MGKQKRWTVGLIIILLLSITGCQGKNADEQAPTDHEVIKVVDCIGREVEVPADVERIACLYAFTGHVVAMLGRGDDIVAINEGLRRDVLLNKVSPGIGDNPVPVNQGSINIEELLKTEPDLVFVKGETGVDEAEVEKLDKFHIPYIVIDYRSMEEQRYAIEVIGKCLGTEQEALDYNNYYQQCIDRVKTIAAQIPEQERVRVFHSVNEATRTVAPGTLEADWSSVTGIINVSVGEPLRFVEGKNFASLEQILLWDADAILVNESGVVNYIMNNSQWQPLKAVQQDRVYQMPIGIARWGHPGSLETPLAILWTAKTIYPGYFMDLDMEEETRSYYKKYFDYEVSDELLDRILSGQEMRITKGSE